MLRTLLATRGIVLVSQIATAQAQDWPQRPITMIVSQPAGASPDVMARMIAERMGKALGQTVIIDN